MQLVLLAAGKGSRLPKFHQKKPKCLVKINKKTLFDHNRCFYDFFKKKIIITGYKNHTIKKKLKKNNFFFVHNSQYKSTNMVYSLFCAKTHIKEDVLICYSDIYIHKNFFQKVKKNGNYIPVYKKWFELWKKRMPKKKIFLDAENLVIKKNKVFEIGTIIKKKIPQYQYMGIVKLKRAKFLELAKYFEQECDPKIDMTSFLNKCIREKKINLSVIKINKKNSWFEIDTAKDINVAKKILN